MDDAPVTNEADHIVDVAFRAMGESLPVDHGYALYSAVSAALPHLHGTGWLGIHPVDGEPFGDPVRRLRLRGRSRVRLRVPANEIESLLRLSGRTLVVAGSAIRLGPPTVFELQPSSSLDARAVHVRLTVPPRVDNPTLERKSLDMRAMEAATLQELKRQLARLGIEGSVELRGRRTLTVGAQRLVTFSTRVSELDAGASLVLQARGLGGKRTMGCGLFRPTRSRE